MPDPVADFISRLPEKPGGVYVLMGEEAQLIEEARETIRIACGTRPVERAGLDALGNPDSPDSQIVHDRGGELFGGGAAASHPARRQGRDRRKSDTPPTKDAAMHRSGKERRCSGASVYEVIGHGKPPEDSLTALHKLVRRLTSADVLTVAIYGMENRHLSRDRKGYKTAWVRDLSTAGELIPARSLSAADAEWWCRRWVKEWKMTVSEDGVKWLAANTEGNLAAAKQCLYKMLFFDEQTEKDDVEQMAAILSGRPRSNIFQLIDAALAGQGKKTISILNILFEVDEPPPLIVWALGNAASGILAAKRGGYPLAMSQNAVKQAREVANRASESAILEVIHRAAYADRIVKGVDVGDVKIALTDVAAGLACLRRGAKIPTPALQYRDLDIE